MPNENLVACCECALEAVDGSTWAETEFGLTCPSCITEHARVDSTSAGDARIMERAFLDGIGLTDDARESLLEGVQLSGTLPAIYAAAYAEMDKDAGSTE